MANYHNVSLYPNQAKLLFSSGPMDWLLTFWGKVFQKRIMDFKRESLSYDRKREIEAINQTASDACDKKGQFKRPRPFDMDISIGFPHSCGDVAIPMQVVQRKFAFHRDLWLANESRQSFATFFDENRNVAVYQNSSWVEQLVHSILNTEPR
ncbi:hypothetical protein CSKR_113410 [Clonorchis sinensis]|uniref:Uncharacterized protein n=1 Tax=Clonorchis sinensis TaxID=79923 RepID=A0A419Q788_CLOSI|nr:hypothetical protein CSKR_113410 [Clonorchis sinensis]